MRNTVLSLSPFGCSLLSLTTTTKAASERQSRNRTSVIFFCKVPYTLMTYYKLLLLIWGAILWIQLIIMIMYINPTTTEQGSSSRSNWSRSVRPVASSHGDRVGGGLTVAVQNGAVVNCTLNYVGCLFRCTKPLIINKKGHIFKKARERGSSSIG